ncbi:MAG: hypothetical protein RLZ98_2620 [Pseudomonadota bacterium]|jgi:NAD(P)-dependent dehydrogenase (short-subunit alcohol dehydrogenase family)
MLMSVLESGVEGLADQYPELESARVLITGLSAANGVDLARAFAEQHTRLVIQHAEPSPEFDALLEILARSAADLAVTQPDMSERKGIVEFAKSAAQTFGGLEVVVNLIYIRAGEIDATATMDEIDDWIAAKLRAPYHITEVAANRMRTTWSEGAIVNIVTLETTASSTDTLLAGLIRTALSNMTRHLAVQWADHNISINAVGPADPSGSSLSETAQHLKSQYDIARLALFLASDKGKDLMGHTFEACGAARAA